MSDFYVDINGQKGPNTMGRDIFYFDVMDDGRVIGEGSKAKIPDQGAENPDDFLPFKPGTEYFR